MRNVLSVRRNLVALEVVGNIRIWYRSPSERRHVELTAVDDTAALVRPEKEGRGGFTRLHGDADRSKLLPDDLNEIVRRCRPRIVLKVDRKAPSILCPH